MLDVAPEVDDQQRFRIPRSQFCVYSSTGHDPFDVTASHTTEIEMYFLGLDRTVAYAVIVLSDLTEEVGSVVVNYFCAARLLEAQLDIAAGVDFIGE